MDIVLRILFLPLQPIVTHPERAFLLAGLFAVLFAASLLRARRFIARYHIVMLGAILAWVLFGLMEQVAVAAGWNIRVDLFVSGPLVLVLSLAAVWAGFRDAFREQPRKESSQRVA